MRLRWQGLVMTLVCAVCMAQEPVTTLRVTSRVVAVSAVVRAKDGSPVTTLTKDDFVLKQDGKEQALRYFSEADDLPLTLTLLVDTSGSQRTLIGDESIAADVFLRTMLQRPQDRAALIQFDAAVTVLHGLTSDPGALQLSMTSLGARKDTANGTLLHDSIVAVTDRLLSKEKGRKAIVLLTDGVDTGSSHALKDAIEEAQKNNAQVYSIYYGAFVGMQPGRNSAFAGRDGREVLKRLSQQTGGRAFEVSPSMGLRAIFLRIADDLRTQYELGYTPPPDTAAGKWHKLEVRVKDKGNTVQARNAFYAEP